MVQGIVPPESLGREAQTIIVHHVQAPQQVQVVPNIAAPNRQVWFMGRRIWNPQTPLLVLGSILALLALGLGPIASLVACGCGGIAVKQGDIRGGALFALGLVLTVLLL